MNEKFKPSELAATVSMREFEQFVRTHVNAHPNLLQSFLTFCAIEKTAHGIRDLIWNQMSKSFPGSDEQKKETLQSLINLSDKLVMDFKMEFSLTPKSNLWKPPEKTINP